MTDVIIVLKESNCVSKALELGDAICLFPEGMSRFHPTIAPLKTGGNCSILSIYNR